MTKLFYGFLCILGTVFPLGFFIAWLADHGANIQLLIMEIMQSRISSFAWADVVVSAIVLIVFVLAEGRRNGMNKLWLPIVATCSIGVSLGLPLFLLMREIHIDKQVV